MMPWCVVIGCRNNLKATKRSGKDVSYHIFPKNPQRRNAWINTLNRPFKFNADSSYICSEHFIPDDFECNSLKEELLNIKVKKQLKKTAIPSINIPNNSGGEQSDISIKLLNKKISSDASDVSFNTSSQFDMQKCLVLNCSNTVHHDYNTPKRSKTIEFHKFPSEIGILEKWLKFCNRPKEFSAKCQNALICSDHFNKEDYKQTCTTGSINHKKELKNDAVPTLNRGIRITDVKSINDESEKRDRKKLVDKLLADYEEQQKNEGHLKGIVNKYPSFFSPKINPNAKLGDKLKLLKAIDNPEMYSPHKKRKISSNSSNSKSLGQSTINSSSQNKDHVIQVSAVKGGLMLHALPQLANNSSSLYSEKNIADEEEEIIIVTEDEASHVDLSSYKEQQKEKNTEVIVVTNLKDTEDTFKHIESVPIKCSTKLNDSNVESCVQNLLKNNETQSTHLYTAKVSLGEDKGCQVLIPCKGCEHRSLKINKLLRERTRLVRDQNQNGTWKDPDEISNLKRMNGVLSLLLMQCINEKNGKKSSSIRVDLVQDSIERIDRGWSMRDTSETLCQALSVNAYDEFARTFTMINEI